MSHHAFQPRGPTFEADADFVVVGSGAGGAMAAVTLARGGKRVALVEAGPWRDPTDYPSSAYGALRDLFDECGTTVTMGRALWPVVQARVVGGTTVINSAIAVRTPSDVFDRWEREFGIRRSNLADSVWRHEDRVEQELCVEEVPPASLGRSNELALLGGKRLAYENHVMRRYTKGCAGSGQCLQGCRSLKKQSTNLNYVPETLSRGGHVLSSAPVDRVVFEGTRALGVRGHFRDPVTRKKGAPFFVRAKEGVVIAASATHSPALLQRSGLRHPALGKYFRAHPGTGVFGVYDEVVDMNIGATQGWASIHYRDQPGLKLETLAIPPEMVAGRLSGAGATLMARVKDFRHLAMWVCAVRAESHGTVHNGFGDRPVVRYTLDRPDMEKLRAGLTLVAKTHFAAGAKRVIPGIYGLPYDLGPDELHHLESAPLDPRAYVAILSHLFGGCVMGTDPAASVTDEQGRVHGYQGLYVADASVIPSNLGVNPQHTIMGLSGHFMERALGAG